MLDLGSMGFLLRLLTRLVTLGLGILAIWVIIFVIYPFADNRTSNFIAIVITYVVSAYLVLPFIVRMGVKLIQYKHAPSYALSGDGLPSDPVNIALIGTIKDLRRAFIAADWAEADPLNLSTSIKMARAFVLSESYPTAPFSTLYLFGRGQDIGFEMAIGNDPRKRHHVRFWGKDLNQVQSSIDTPEFWLNTDKPDEAHEILWVGTGTRDTGLALSRLTFQFTHATDDDANEERDFIIESLKGSITETSSREATKDSVTPVNRYITDGKVTIAKLKVS
jgi:hypothetical protein